MADDVQPAQTQPDLMKRLLVVLYHALYVGIIGGLAGALSNANSLQSALLAFVMGAAVGILIVLKSSEKQIFVNAAMIFPLVYVKDVLKAL